MAPPDAFAVTPPDHLTGQAVAGGLLLLCADPTRASELLPSVLALGREIAAGHLRWDTTDHRTEAPARK